jgi:ribonuclease J
LLAEFPDIAIYGGRLTLGIMRGRLREHPDQPATLNMHEVEPGEERKSGPFTVEWIRVGHSIPDACGLAITPTWAPLIQTGDFKIDQTPVDGRMPQFLALRAAWRERSTRFAVRHTNAGRPGLAGGESTVRPGIERIFADAPGRIFVATFARMCTACSRSRYRAAVQPARRFYRAFDADDYRHRH